MQEKEEKLNVYGQVLCKEINLVLRITLDMYQHLKNLYGLTENGLSLHTLRPVEAEMNTLYDKLKQEEAFLASTGVQQPSRLQEMLEDIIQLKRRIKMDEVFQQMGAEEIVKLMVMIYNIGEIISKMEMIASQRYA